MQRIAPRCQSIGDASADLLYQPIASPQRRCLLALISALLATWPVVADAPFALPLRLHSGAVPRPTAFGSASPRFQHPVGRASAAVRASQVASASLDLTLPLRRLGQSGPRRAEPRLASALPPHRAPRRSARHASSQALPGSTNPPSLLTQLHTTLTIPLNRVRVVKEIPNFTRTHNQN